MFAVHKIHEKNQRHMFLRETIRTKIRSLGGISTALTTTIDDAIRNGIGANGFGVITFDKQLGNGEFILTGNNDVSQAIFFTIHEEGH